MSTDLMNTMFKEFVGLCKGLYQGKDFIPLHAPVMGEREKEVLSDCVDSTFVSSVGEFSREFECKLKEFTGAPHVILTTNGTSALHLALHSVGVNSNSEVLVGALGFVATANAISYCGADPVFIDSSSSNLGLSPDSLQEFLEGNTFINDDGECVNKNSGKVVRACLPTSVFGHPLQIDQILNVCRKHHIEVVQDAAESLGSFDRGIHVGLRCRLSAISFNGNKVITTGGGGAILCTDEELAQKLRHLSTTARTPGQMSFAHDEVGFNYRLPALNAAFGCAQMERLIPILRSKREISDRYREFFKSYSVTFLEEGAKAKVNYWLNAVFFSSRQERDSFLEFSNKSGIQTRPVWELLPDLPMYRHFQKTDLTHARKYQQTGANIPSGAVLKEIVQ